MASLSKKAQSLVAATRCNFFAIVQRRPCGLQDNISRKMSIGIKRTDLHALAKAKLDDAKLLLANRRYSNAYYLAGYAVELALKATIAKQIAAETLPDKKMIEETYRGHDLQKLAGIAGLYTEMKSEQDANPDFAANWAIVTEWEEKVRYETVDPYTAQTFIQAIDDPTHGVLPWIKARW